MCVFVRNRLAMKYEVWASVISLALNDGRCKLRAAGCGAEEEWSGGWNQRRSQGRRRARAAGVGGAGEGAVGTDG
jgi:hypothetical protein